MKQYIFLLFLFSVIQLSAQKEKIDSLWNEYRRASHDTTRIQLLFDIGYLYEFYTPDTALLTYRKIISITDKNIGKQLYTENELTRKYATFKAKAIMYTGIVVMDQARYPEAMKYYQLAKSIFTELEDNKGISNCLNNIGIIYQEIGQFQESLDAYYQSLNELKKLNDQVGIARLLNNIGIIYHDLGNYEKSLDYYLQSLKIKETLGDKRGVALTYNNIGIVHKENGNNEKAIEYYQLSLHLAESIGDNKSAANALNNIANVYLDLGNDLKKKSDKENAANYYKKAIDYNVQAMKIRESLGDKKGVAHSEGNIASIYMQQGDGEMALSYFMKSLEILKEIDEQAAIAGVYNNLASLYTQLADSIAGSNPALYKKYLELAVKNGEESYRLSEQLGMLFQQSTAAKTLMNTYRKIGNLQKSLYYADKHIECNDLLFNQEKTRALTDAEKKFESEKKQLQIEKLNKEKELQQSEISREKEISRRQKLIIVFVILGLLLISVFAVFVVHRLRITRKQKRIIEEQKKMVDEKNALLSLQNEEIRAQRDEIESQRDEIATQRDTVIKQRDFIEEQKKAITDSITYAKRIQTAMIPDPSILMEPGIISDYFVLYKPKDIVSGDFYWVTRISDWLILTVADCTGHGVPGAFMSMLGMSYLNEVVRKKEITRAGDALDALRKSVIEALQQKESARDFASGSNDMQVKDGMDICFCVVNMQTGILQYAGANNSLYIARKTDSDTDYTLMELEADKQPVGIHVNMKPFGTKEMQLEDGDCLYLMSDGYADQFGGPSAKKFKIKSLKELILSIASRPMQEQYEILDKTFSDWKGSYKQIDDVTIAGIRIRKDKP